MKLFTIEGNSIALDGGSMFGSIPKAMWEKWIPCDDENRIRLHCRTLVLEKEGRVILFDAGMGPFFDPKMKKRYLVESNEHILLQELEKKGIGEEDVDAVILSHLHFDHAGGLLPPYGEEERLLFPKARYYVGKDHWDRAQKPHRRERGSFLPNLHTLLAKSKRLFLIDGKTHPDFGDEITFQFYDGHTIGLLVARIQHDPPIYFVSDLIPGAPWVHLPVTMGFDRFPELAVDEKADFLENSCHEKAVFVFPHDPKNESARVIQNAKGGYDTEYIGLSDS